MFKNINKIFEILDHSQKKEFKILILLMFLAMILETVGIGSMIPLINYFTSENALLLHNINLNHFFLKFGIPEKNILNFILIFIIIIFFIKNLYVCLYSWIESKFSYKVRFGLGVRLFNKYLHSPYLFHVENSSSNLTTKIVQETSVYGGALMALSVLLTEILVILGLIIFLLIVRPLETLIIILIAFILSSIFYLAIRKIILRLGKKRELAHKAQIKSVQQGLGAIKDIIFYQAQRNFINIFHSDSDDIADVGFKMRFLQKLPRIWFELATITIITYVIFFLSMQKLETGAIMAIIGLFLISSIRIIPSINRILVSLQEIKYSEPSFDKLLVDLNQIDLEKIEISRKDDRKISFQKEIKFNNICFNYPKSDKLVLKNINFTIKKNEFVGIVGETGSGKSTLVDLLIGLINPDSGTITVDGTKINNNLNSWRKNLGYVPQNLYLIDDTINKNIAFGKRESEISDLSTKDSIVKSQLLKFISNLKKGVESKVGERGVKVSGGEKQRIGIARALYNNPEVLIFDEATSALDLNTESKILKMLLDLNRKKTIIFITHRKSSLNMCDRVFQIRDNKIEEIKKSELF